jgi:L-ascorbate metabolism protein UlaG (beta-lactamase superfamily)
MEIYWLGNSCFRLRGRDAAVVTNPCPPSTGYRIGRLTADIVAISRRVPENEALTAISGAPKLIQGPGEYEIAGVLVTGVRTDHEPKQSPAVPRNVAYVLDLDDVRICFLGDIAQVPSGDVEALTAADVLMVPVGGGGLLNAEKAAEAVSLLEPKLVVPMRYRTEVSTADLEPVDRFLREMGAEAKAPEARLSVTKSNVPSDTTVVVLGYRGG